MKNISVGTQIAGLTAIIVLSVCGIWLISHSETSAVVIAQSKDESSIQKPVVLPESNNKNVDEPSDLLDKSWRKDENFEYLGYTITKKCSAKADERFIEDNCGLKIFKGKKRLAKFQSARDTWLEYGLFNFLGGESKQLIVHDYSGGAHCCYSYTIYDLKPTFRVLYDSNSSEEGNIGNSLSPVDLDKDGVFEFERSVMTFDYFHTAHSGSVFPPAIFRFDRKNQKFRLANKLFSANIVERKNKYVKWLETTYGSESSIYKQGVLHLTFAYLIYAGEEKAAWKYFEENYDLEDKESFKNDAEKLFSKDLIYKSIYGK